MSIYVACRCGQAFSAPLEYAGQTVGCPACGQALVVPAPAATSAASPWQPAYLPSPTVNPNTASSNPALVVGGIVVGVLTVVLLLFSIGQFFARPQATATNVVELGVPPKANSAVPVVSSRVPAPIVVPLESPVAPASAPATPTSPAPVKTVELSASPFEKLAQEPQPAKGAKVDRFLLGGGLYQLDVPAGEWGGEQVPTQSVPRVVYTGQGEYAAATTTPYAAQRAILIHWEIIARYGVSSALLEPGAKPITVNGLAGHEFDKHQQDLPTRVFVFPFSDHTLKITYRCINPLLDLPDVRRVQLSLKRLKPLPADVLAWIEPSRPTGRAATSAPPPAAQSNKVDTVLLADGMYRLDAPGSELYGVEGPIPAIAGVKYGGGAKFEHRLGNDIRTTRFVHINWVVFIKPQDLTQEMKNPAARPITINGLQGHEIPQVGPTEQQRHLTFKFPDHVLMVTFRCVDNRLDAPEVQRVIQSLKRLKPVPAEILAMPAAQRGPDASARSTPGKDFEAGPNAIRLANGKFTLTAPGHALAGPEESRGEKGVAQFYLGTAKLPGDVSLGWLVMHMPNRNFDLTPDTIEVFNSRGKLFPAGGEAARKSAIRINDLSGVEKRFTASSSKNETYCIQRIFHFPDYAVMYAASGRRQSVESPETLKVLDSLRQ